MCISPNFVWIKRGANWEQNPTPCRKCWRCKKNRVNDYVARCMAESATSAYTCTLTLTYAPRDDLADKEINPAHFQSFIRLLRKQGHKIRYLVVGEYGELKGRAHFHAILFISKMGPPSKYKSGDVPRFSLQIPQKINTHIREWPHGHISCDWTPSQRAARYVCKYLLADHKKTGWFSLSKQPALGAAWFRQRAAIAQEMGVLPSSFEYQPPNCSTKQTYMMTGATRRDYLNAITQSKQDRSRMSEWVQKTFDKYAFARAVAAGEQYIAANPDAYTTCIQETLEIQEKLNQRSYEAQLRSEAWAEFYAMEGGPPQLLAWRAKQWGFSDVETFTRWQNSPEGHAALGFCPI